jgi:hypothetical protein
MVGFKYLTCSLFVFAAWSPFRIDNSVAEPSVKPCDEIQVTEKIIHPKDNSATGEIHLTFSDKGEEYTLFLFASEKSKNQLEIKSNKIVGLEKGEYTLFIQSKAGCNKKMKIKLK